MEKILRQSFWLVAAQVLARVIGFFYVIYLARSLGVADFGLYTLALAYFSIISSFADFGFNRFLIREVATDRSKAQELLWNIVLLRVSLTSVLFAIFSITLYLLDPDKLRVSVILLGTLAILPQSIALTFDAIFVAVQKLQFSAVSLFVASLSTALAGFVLVSRSFGSIGAVSALIFGQLLYLLALVIFLRKQAFSGLPPFKFTIIKKIVLGSLPYGILGIIGLVSFRVDTVILAYFKGNFDTGIYGAAYKFLDAVVFIPAALASASFPVFAKSFADDLSDVKKVYFRSMKIMLMVGLLVMIGYLYVIPEIMKLLLPNYLSSIEVLKILSLAIPLIFLHVPSGQVLLSTDKYLKDLLVIYIALFSVNLFLYLSIIPIFGVIGAAWTTVASEAFTLLVFYIYLNSKVFKKS